MIRTARGVIQSQRMDWVKKEGLHVLDSYEEVSKWVNPNFFQNSDSEIEYEVKLSKYAENIIRKYHPKGNTMGDDYVQCYVTNALLPDSTVRLIRLFYGFSKEKAEKFYKDNIAKVTPIRESTPPPPNAAGRISTSEQNHEREDQQIPDLDN